ncbi:hypothetical protein M0R04_01000 [Candidatus Dojkabacteria bacterium]|jgi:hypothetical protein|nr:hypothetical protein [Candidatus Dojkabacteria bacterium]
MASSDFEKELQNESSHIVSSPEGKFVLISCIDEEGSLKDVKFPIEDNKVFVEGNLGEIPYHIGVDINDEVGMEWFTDVVRNGLNEKNISFENIDVAIANPNIEFNSQLMQKYFGKAPGALSTVLFMSGMLFVTPSSGEIFQTKMRDLEKDNPVKQSEIIDLCPSENLTCYPVYGENGKIEAVQFEGGVIVVDKVFEYLYSIGYTEEMLKTYGFTPDALQAYNLCDRDYSYADTVSSLSGKCTSYNRSSIFQNGRLRLDELENFYGVPWRQLVDALNYAMTFSDAVLLEEPTPSPISALEGVVQPTLQPTPLPTPTALPPERAIPVQTEEIFSERGCRVNRTIDIDNNGVGLLTFIARGCTYNQALFFENLKAAGVEIPEEIQQSIWERISFTGFFSSKMMIQVDGNNVIFFSDGDIITPQIINPGIVLNENNLMAFSNVVAQSAEKRDTKSPLIIMSAAILLALYETYKGLRNIPPKIKRLIKERLRLTFPF